MLLAGMSSGEEHFSTPKTPVWGHVSARGHPSREVPARPSCTATAKRETEFAGGAQRITEHYAKCKSVPVGLKEWEVEKLGRSAAKRQGKGAVKKMEGMFDDIARDSDQALILVHSSRRHST